MKKTQSQYSFGLASNRKMFRKGMTEGIPPWAIWLFPFPWGSWQKGQD